MLPPETVIRAAARWVWILNRSTIAQAWGLVGADASYADTTQTQYGAALDWLSSIELLVKGPAGPELAPAAKGLSPAEAHGLIFERSLERAAPAWLLDADILVPDSGELPQDAIRLAQTLGLDDDTAFLRARQVYGRIDLAERSRVGLCGETALVALLESRWPGSTNHVAKTNDGFGYDVAFNCGGTDWHLEIKSTTRRGRLVIYLSRHEYEVGSLDPNWRLLVVGLGDDLQINALATVKHEGVLGRAPTDASAKSTWQSVKHELAPTDLEPGLTFLQNPATDTGTPVPLFDSRMVGGFSPYAWMPPSL